MGQDQRPAEPRKSALARFEEEQNETRLTLAQRVNLLLEEPDSSVFARAVSYIVLVSILASVVGFILQTEPSLMDSVVLKAIEVGSMAIFTVEYIARFLVCNAFRDQDKCTFLFAPSNVVDLLAIFPVYLLGVFLQSDSNPDATKPLRVLRAVRLVRIFRIFKLSKYSAGMTIMVESMTNSARPLVVLMFLLSIGITFFSSLVYHAEAAYCPAYEDMTSAAKSSYRADCTASTSGFSSDGWLCCNEYGSPEGFESILAAFWWSMVTMTTVGYGDMAPKTPLGRAVGFVAMIAGIVLISLPVAIVGNKFQQAYEEMEENSAAERQGKENAARAAAGEVELQPDGSTPGPVFQTIRFLVKAKMLTESGSSSGGGSSAPASPKSAGGLKPITSQDTEGTTPKASSGSQSPELPNLQPTSKWNDRSMRHASELRKKLKMLEGRRALSRAAQGQVELTLELLDHLEAVDVRLARLKEKDAALDVCIHRDFVALSRVCASKELANGHSSVSGTQHVAEREHGTLHYTGARCHFPMPVMPVRLEEKPLEDLAQGDLESTTELIDENIVVQQSEEAAQEVVQEVVPEEVVQEVVPKEVDAREVDAREVVQSFDEGDARETMPV